MNGHDACVLIIDDDISIRERLSDLIRSTGMKVKTFASAQDFFASPHADPPDCILLDVQLPRWCELYLQNESAKAQPQIPIVFICSHDDIPMTVLLMKSNELCVFVLSREYVGGSDKENDDEHSRPTA